MKGKGDINTFWLIGEDPSNPGGDPITLMLTAYVHLTSKGQKTYCFHMLLTEALNTVILQQFLCSYQQVVVTVLIRSYMYIPRRLMFLY